MKKKKSSTKKRLEKNKKFTNEKNSQTPESRRSFLKKVWAGLGVLAGVEFAAVIFGFLFSGKGNKNDYVPKQMIEAGSVNSFQPNTVTVFRGGRFYLTRLEDGGFIAISLRCTHLGCSIEWEDEKKRFICPCHSSAFSMTGDVKNPPAPKALDYYPVIIEDGIIKVDVGTKLERERYSKDQIVYA
jgi:cytochrome b6-f complex iron-sulfur subunit